jgi:uroporphyrinogen decarboxylase
LPGPSYQGKNRRAVNLLKTIYFDYPEWTPCSVGLLPATWMKYRQDLEALILDHRRVFPGYRQGSRDYDQIGHPLYEEGEHTDCWGCVWKNIAPGFDSMIHRGPLEDWAAFDSWRPPDPKQDAPFGPQPTRQEIEKQCAAAKARGDLAGGGVGLPHGFFYMLLFYLRGFDNLMIDLASGDPRLQRLIDIVIDYNIAVIGRDLDAGAEIVYVGEDLGMQDRLPMSPDMWRRYVKPGYEAMFGPCRDRGIPVYLHSDGHVLEIIPDLIDVGVRVLNPQIRANGLAGLQRWAKGKVALNQDLDRQLFPFASPAQVEDHIVEVFQGLYLREGGLMLLAECGPDVPLETMDVICRTFERIGNLPDPSDLDSPHA